MDWSLSDDDEEDESERRTSPREGGKLCALYENVMVNVYVCIMYVNEKVKRKRKRQGKESCKDNQSSTCM